ncbi:MAG: 3-oxoacyl-[acyl-carrier-protein] reductase, partial [Chlamydiae bacterium RIFCSPHIGHO2_12_FULL_44_59]
MQLLKGKTALITGGTAGIGKAIACLYLEHGAHVIIVGTSLERAQAALKEVEEHRAEPGQKAASFLADVSKTKEVDGLIGEILKNFGQVDILVNNAGITKDNLLMKMDEADWDLVMDVNLKSVYNTCRALSRPMMKARGGVMINITSVVGLTGNAGQANYAASKAGMIGLTKSLAKELASRGIRANCIAPGYIRTQMTEKLPEPVKEVILSKIPMSRMGSPQDIAHAALFLASDLASYVTGQVLTVDGG